MTTPWDPPGAIPYADHVGALVTLVEGAAFAVSGRSGDMLPESPHGLFVLDTRIVSRLQLRLDGKPPEPLGVVHDDPFSATFVQRAVPPPGRADGGIVVQRHRWVGQGMREDIVLRSYLDEPVTIVVELHLDADFADLFEVKEDRVPAGTGGRAVEFSADRLEMQRSSETTGRGVKVCFSPPPVSGPQIFGWDVSLAPGDEWRLCLEVTASVDGEWLEGQYRCGEPVERAAPRERLTQWRMTVPSVETDHEPLERAVRRASDDLGSLRMFDPEHPGRTVVAAGAPWFMALFGRDSLLTAWMALLADPTLALGVLQTLAGLQGTEVDTSTEEQPGRIAHEVRLGAQGVLSLGGKSVYYGTVDATPLFVMLLGELRRWGLADVEVEQLMPHADRALTWIREFGDRDGDGYVEYERLRPDGLANQGWKDSWDSIRFADGRFAQTPIALCEVQAYTYAAYVARSHFAEESGDTALAIQWATAAGDLKAAFNRDFWLEDRQAFALALDRDKRPVDAIASNMGHCLWAGIVDEEKAPAVAAHLLSEAMFSGWGVRTLADSMAPFNPISYHNGSVWPHDSAIVAAGLMRYGFVEQAQRIIAGLLDVAEYDGGRLPELFCGFQRTSVGAPISYPTSCSPQAWAAAAPLLMVRSLLRLDPAIPNGQVFLDPVLPKGVQRLRVHNVPLGAHRVTINVDGDSTSVEGLTDGVELVREPRRPLRAIPRGGGR